MAITGGSSQSTTTISVNFLRAIPSANSIVQGCARLIDAATKRRNSERPTMGSSTILLTFMLRAANVLGAWTGRSRRRWRAHVRVLRCSALCPPPPRSSRPASWQPPPPVRLRRLRCPPPSPATLVRCGASRGLQRGGCLRRPAPTRACVCGRPLQACWTAGAGWQTAASAEERGRRTVQKLKLRVEAMEQRARRRAGPACLLSAGTFFPGRCAAWRGTRMDGTAGLSVRSLEGIWFALLGRCLCVVGFLLLVFLLPRRT